uniref:hypothetical protein n=1 Tax=Wolbachia endosymbiont of Laodelphax striatellus TaxID=368602 RepID=UPI000ABE7273|nr:hypothetical protein [Wolbachia endosymbiont of Laodelphax striatellus]
MHSTQEKEIHLIFFHGLGDNYKNATTFCKDMQSELMHHHDILTLPRKSRQKVKTFLL